MDINSDMDRYLRERRRAKVFSYHDRKESWWDRIFAPKQKGLPDDDLPPAEAAKLESMEQEIRKGEEKLERAQAVEHRLEVEQEERVSFYQRLRNLFQREQQVEEAYEHVEMMEHQMAAPANDAGVTEDFRTMAQIQVRWMERLPTRVKEEFKESEDYVKLKDILKRRGVSKKQQ